MALKHTLLSLAILTCLLSSGVAVRELPLAAPGFNLTARLEAAEGSGGSSLVDCWSAMTEIRSCSNEIVMFFMNGTADHIGSACCNAVGTITHHCWPAMLTSLGFTPDECNVLRGYCDATSNAGGGDGPAPSPSLMI